MVDEEPADHRAGDVGDGEQRRDVPLVATTLARHHQLGHERETEGEDRPTTETLQRTRSTSTATVVLRPAMIEPIANTTIAIWNRRCVPYRSANLPANGTTTVDASR